jgi:hypothetical protein
MDKSEGYKAFDTLEDELSYIQGENQPTFVEYEIKKDVLLDNSGNHVIEEDSSGKISLAYADNLLSRTLSLYRRATHPKYSGAWVYNVLFLNHEGWIYSPNWLIWTYPSHDGIELEKFISRLVKINNCTYKLEKIP